MSHNQKNNDSSSQYRKTGRSNSFNNNQQQQPRQQFPKGGGGPGSSTPSGPSSNRSFNKRYNNNNNAQGGQTQQGGQVRPRSPNVSLDASKPTVAAPVVPNGAHQQQPTRGVADAPVTSAPATVKPTVVQDPKVTAPVTKAMPSSVPSAAQPPNVSSSSESKAAATPTKAPGDASRAFPLQFGSISPGVMNGVQIPARTSSAPPNLDEQKKAQARHESLRAAPAAPVPSIPKQHLPKKDERVVDQTNACEPQTQPKPKPKPKRENQVAAVPHMTQSQKPAMHSIPMHMQLPFHHPHHHQMQVPVQFGGPNPQFPSQAMSGTSMAMPLPMMANPAAQQPMFVTGLPTHPMQSQGMLHQGQGMNFSSQMGPQINPQLGNMGMGMGSQFPQQHVGKFNSSRKTVKITHPVTREELMLDGSSSGQRSHPNVLPQSQPVPSFSNHPLSSYPNFYPPGSSVPLNNAQVPPTSQPRLYSQVTVKPPVVISHAEKEAMPHKVRKAEPLKPSKESPSEVKSDVSSNSDSSSAPLTSSSQKSVESINDARTEALGVDSGKDKNINMNDKSYQDKVEVKSADSINLPSQSPQNEGVEPKPTNNLVSGVAKGSLSKTVQVSSDVSNSNIDDSASKVSPSQGASVTQSNVEAEEKKEKGEVEAISSESNNNSHSLVDSLKSLSLDSSEILAKSEESSSKEVKPMITSSSSENTGQKEEISTVCSENVKVDDNLGSSSKITEGENKVAPVSSSGSLVQNDETDTVSVPSPLESETGNTKNDGADLISSVKDKISPDTIEPKPAMPKGKMKKKDLYKKAEAAGTSSDLYNAYKGPEEKKEAVISTEEAENASTISVKQPPVVEKPSHNKVEPDDWEDAAEISTPQLETSNNGVNVDNNALTIKNYSRDFLLKFAEQCVDLPDGFEITSDIADVLMSSSVNVPRDSFLSPGRNNERPNSRSDRRGVGMGEDDKWNKFPVIPMLGRGDTRGDFGYAANVIGMRPGQGGNYGVLRNPRAQSPVLSGPMQSFGPGLQRNNSESDRWQRGTNFQKGLMPSPQGPMPVIHRAEKKYEVGKVTDEEQAKQRQLKGILNKLTPQNFEKLFQQVKEVNIDNVVTLEGVISQIFDKALMEPTFCEMYANFCFHLSEDLPDLSMDNQKITFKRLLLNKCQEEFERGEREEEEANKAEAEGEINQTAEEREEKRLQTRRRMLGNIRLIGELYKKKMLTERIMHECMNKLLGQHENPDEENIEALCKLMSTIGEMIDHSRAKEHMDYYFSVMLQLSNNMKLSSRVRFMLRDSIDLRKNKWQQRRKVEGPKKIDEVHRDAAQERHAQSTRLARGPSFGTSVRRAPPMEFTPRTPNMLTSPISQMGGFRPVSPHMRGYNNSQDARMEERHLSVPLTQRPLGEDSITLGPQGGLARGMAIRGQPSGPGVNGFGSMPERAAYGQREDPGQRYGPDRSIYEQFHAHEQYGNRVARNADQSIDRSRPSPPARGGPPIVMQHAFTESLLSEDQLHDKSMAAIKEFYSARDEKEVAMCIKDLNTPSFYPSLISLWITDSFERKDMERDLLTKLLINLSHDGIIIQDQLLKGFESVLTILEDAENDAPRASEFLGYIFAKVIMENIIPLSEIGRLIYEGGEEQGRLLETGLAAKVLGSILEIIKLEKGDSVLNEIRSSSNLELGKFRPPGSNKLLTIDKFI